jgi:hypothetical protein
MFFVIYFIFMIAIYCWVAYCLMGIMERCGSTRERWWAWVPILNMYALWELSDLEIVWFVLMFIPFIDIVAIIMIMMPVAEKCGSESYWGILMIVPIFNFYVIWKLGYGE